MSTAKTPIRSILTAAAQRPLSAFAETGIDIHDGRNAMGHLDDSTFDGYLSRSLGRDHLRALDDHVATCLDCTLAVELAALDENRWQRRGPLGRLTHVTPARSENVALLPMSVADARAEPAQRRAS